MSLLGGHTTGGSHASQTIAEAFGGALLDADVAAPEEPRDPALAPPEPAESAVAPQRTHNADDPLDALESTLGEHASQNGRNGANGRNGSNRSNGHAPANAEAAAVQAPLRVRRSPWPPALIEAAATAAALMTASALAVLFGFAPGAGEAMPRLLFSFGGLTLLVISAARIYRPPVDLGTTADLIRIIKCVSVAAAVTLAVREVVASPETGTSPIWPLWLNFILLTFLADLGARRLTATIARGHGDPRLVLTLIVGGGPRPGVFAAQMAANPGCGMAPVGFVDGSGASNGRNANGGREARGLPTWTGLDEALMATGASRVIVKSGILPSEEVDAAVRRCEELGVEVALAPGIRAAINHRVKVQHVVDQPILHLAPAKSLGAQFTIKHAYERVVATAVLIPLAPLFAVAATAVKLSSPGPVFYRQTRVGRDGKELDVIKFRTMRPAPKRSRFVPAEGLAPGGVEGDDRTTAVGRLLRRTSIDELPQLLNVVKGEMSLVGPRPERPEYVELFRKLYPEYAYRHRVRAGLTGWAQIHGLRGQTSLTERLRYDNYYIENWSHGLDLQIMLRTVPAMLRVGHSLERAVTAAGGNSSLGRR